MILTSTEEIAGRTTAEVLGLVTGSTVRARHVGKDLQAVMENFVGGEVAHYTKLLAEARDQALDRMSASARAMGADAVVCVRFGTSEIATGAAEILAYGTAIKLAPA